MMPSTSHLLCAPLLALGVANVSAAQSLNIDFGNGPVPADTYAAGGMPGTWNSVPGIGPMTYGPLVDLAGDATAADVILSAGSEFSDDNPDTSGDDEALMDDLACAYGNGASAPTEVTITGLLDGEYEIYSYAWAPDNPGSFVTEVSVALSSDPAQLVTGDWPGAQMQGVTFALHTGVIVSGGGDVVVTFDQDSGNPTVGSINGIQVFRRPIIGSLDPLCVPNANSLGLTAKVTLEGTAVAGNVILARCTDGVPSQFGYFISGPAGFYFSPPGSEGIICIGSPAGRYNSGSLSQVFVFDVDGVSTNTFDGGQSVLPTDGSWSPVSAVVAGETRGFQAWHRDNIPAPTSNFSDSVLVTFL
ncbi:MAG: hypothetical protein GY711_24140 [bacterium]|nr:hypothetical protein [bacterium]